MRKAHRHSFIHILIFCFFHTIAHVLSLQSEGRSELPTKISNGFKGTTPSTMADHSIHEQMPPKERITTPISKLERKENESQDANNSNKTPSKMEHGGSIIGDVVENLLIEEDDSEKPSPPSKLDHAVSGMVDTGIGIHEYMSKETNNTRENETTKVCISPAIKQFPRPLMSLSTRRHGGLILHIVVAIYMFIGLAIVCDEYFVASLDRICEELHMSPDVAGATFMAAGSSAPELATVIIGVFLAKDDIGISGVIGSAVFNIMFVISVCALATSTVVYLNWWPLVRDCIFYALSILIMLLVIYDETISWVGSVVMLLTYGLYCIVLRFNPILEQWAQTLPVPFKVPQPANEQSGLVSYKTLDEDANKIPSYGITTPDLNWPEDNIAHQDYSGAELNRATTTPPPSAPPAPVATTGPVIQSYYKPKEYDPAAYVNPLFKPTGGGLYVRFKWILLYPIHWLCINSMPNCRTEKYKNWYPFTFFMSMVWISFYSYFMVWMITIIGFTLGIPDTVMGLTFVAAGVSVPDALSSIAVIKEGYGDMAVSNAIGSNVFDILVCLGLPWFIQTAIVHPGSSIKVISKGIPYSTLSLLSTVIFLVVATHYNGWKLDRKFGIVLMVWYLIFITIASLYELNVFGNWNPKECWLDW